MPVTKREPVAPPHGNRVVVLLATADEALRDRVSTLFAHDATFELCHTAQLAQCLAKVETERVGAVLLDLELTDVSGMTTFRRLQGAAPHLAIVVLLNAHDRRGAALTEAGAQDYIVKADLRDLDSARLFHSVRQAMRRQRTLTRLHHKVGEVEGGLDTLVMSHVDGMVMLDDDGIIRFVNPAAEALFGRTRDVLIGRPFGFPVVDGETTELDIMHARGRRTVVEMRATTIDWRGERRWLAALRDVTAHKEADEALATLNQELETRVEKRTQEVRGLARELTLAETRERNRIAQILHDDLQQQLYAVQFALKTLRARLTDTGAEQLASAQDLLKVAIAICRNTSADLSSSSRQGNGLADALTGLAHTMHERYGLKVNLELPETLPPTTSPVRILLFGLVRELLFNVTKHAESDEASIVVEKVGDRLELSVSDKGKGFCTAVLETKPSRASTGLGLSGMRRRLVLFGGELAVDSRPGQGTRVTIVLPVSLLELD